jgi:arginase
MDIRLIACPYHLGHREVEIGAGPLAFLESGAEQALEHAGHEVSAVTIAPPQAASSEIAAIFEVNKLLATEVRDAFGSGVFPIVLAGNCNHCLGAVSGVGLAELGIVWFDAHGDFNSPDTSQSGFFDGMALHVATGNSWHALAGTIPGFRPVAERNVALAGVRDLDEAERAALDASSVVLVEESSLVSAGIEPGLAPPLDAVSSRMRDVYVHVDLDVLDPKTAPINGYQPPGGLQVSQLVDALEMVGRRFQVRAATLASYDPACDPEGGGLNAGLEVLKVFGDIGWGP